MIKKIYKRTKNLFWALLFPQFCVGCGEEGQWLCSRCQNGIVPVVSQVCPECGRLSQNGQYHLKCSKGKALAGIIAAAYFEEGPIREMIHNLKYSGVLELVKPLSDLAVNALKHNFQAPITPSTTLGAGNDQSITNNQIVIWNLEFENCLDVGHCDLVISFAPLHWRRRAQRGYNQAELLARSVGEQLDIPVIDALIKTKKTKRQVELKREKRRENLKGVFKVKRYEVMKLKKKTVILVDDVYTTGSTLNECARVLKKAGAREVWGLVVARG